MYILIAILSMLGHAVQTALMAGYYRRFDPLAASAARGLSLGISMLPLLFFAESGALLEIFNHPMLLLGAALSAALGNWCGAKSFRYLPVGIAAASQQGLLVLSAALIALFSFSEHLSLVNWLGIGLILLGNALAVWKEGSPGVASEGSSALGVLYCVLSGVFMGVAFSLVAQLSRTVDPFVTAYSWEFLIGIISTLMVIARARVRKLAIPQLDPRTFWSILLCASPTAVGTGCYAVAVTMGPVGIVTAIISTLVVMAAVISYFIYGERLTLKQIVAIGIVVAAMVLVRLSEGL